MKRSVNSLIGFTMGATDGEIGKVKEFYFDDETWTIRYLIVETGGWLFGRKVLISPIALLTPDWENEIIPINLTKEHVKNSPGIDSEKPVSMSNVVLGKDKNSTKIGSKGNSHLRSTKKVTSYKINADYGEIGSIEDFLIDVCSWKIDFIVVDTGNLFPGKKVLISPSWIKDINWENSEVTVNATVDSIKNSPEYDPSKPMTDEYSSSLHLIVGK